MMRSLLLQSHYTAEEAYSILMLLDELRDAIWQNYSEDIIKYCQQETKEHQTSFDFDDDIIPF